MPADFLDTNVLLYLVTDDPKRDRARALLVCRPRISVQVLNEVANAGRRKLRLTWAEIGLFLEGLRAYVSIDPLTEQVHRAGLRLAERYGFSTYDAMIVAAALEANCATLWSEDMRHGLRVDDRLTIRNPFLAPEGAPA